MPNIFKIPGIFMTEKVPPCKRNVGSPFSQDGTIVYQRGSHFCLLQSIYNFRESHVMGSFYENRIAVF